MAAPFYVLSDNRVRLPPRRGKSALRSASKLTSISWHSAAKTSPSGGGAVGRRGAFPSRQRRGCMVFQRAKRGLHVFPSRQGRGFEGFIIMAPFIFEGAYHNPRAVGPSNLRTLRPKGRSILRTFYYYNPSTQPAAAGGHNLRRSRPPSEPFEPSEPSEPFPWYAII